MRQHALQIAGSANSAGIEVHDLVPVFRGEENPSRFYAADGHFSEEGACFVAAGFSDNLAHDVRSKPGRLNLTELTRGKDQSAGKQHSDPDTFTD
ncbi:hypothetical protein GR183_18640 [Stappia sp. GBMRC 2046]|uniref:AlgX/AlgJ SGNH hydrolase-like domain-containing protein n=1 Tax=Stappia sediminis TaxID=2692190 RepID=A0A7X3LXN3_9HYPH|nr:hypothetical protein [Stappia sediminis]MXN66936.1 hypothetical protein [Stappia sediminis]